jgi:predicted acyltransferase
MCGSERNKYKGENDCNNRGKTVMKKIWTGALRNRDSMNPQTAAMTGRIYSIDALRGFAMFLILAIDIGGAPVFKTFTQMWGENFAAAASEQFSYGFTKGLRLCFIAMPMFLFVVGLVIPSSLNNRLLKGEKKKLYFHIIRRSLILFLLGLIAGVHLLNLKFADIRVYNNVLEYIAIGYLVCSIIVLNSSRNFQIVLVLFLLALYWIIFLVIPVPGWEGEVFSGKMNLAIHIDNIVLGNHHNPGSWQVLATVSFISNMLLGVLMGHIVFSSMDKKDKTKWLFTWGSLMLITGSVWGLFFPVIRSLWTSSFVLVTCGISTLLLASFYLIMDVWGFKKWALFFVVFGVNSIAVYMMAHLFDFRLIGNILVGGISSLFSPEAEAFIKASTAMAVMWLIMYYMYKKKTFIKV